MTRIGGSMTHRNQIVPITSSLVGIPEATGTRQNNVGETKSSVQINN